MLGIESDFFVFGNVFFSGRAGVAGMEPGAVVMKKLMASMHRKREIEAQILKRTVLYLVLFCIYLFTNYYLFTYAR